MKQGVWLPFYEAISAEFGYLMERYLECAGLLNSFLEPPDLGRLESLILGQTVNVFGAGPSLEKLKSIPDGVNIACDGTSSFLLEKGVVPDIIVTDLDGRVDDLRGADEKGALIVLHAHGDNRDRVARLGPQFNNLYGTTQTEVFGNLLNFGGFTDGDRAVFLAEHFKPSLIRLYGMDFNSLPGRYSFTEPDAGEVKKKKLKWAKKLVEYVIENSDVEIVFV